RTEARRGALMQAMDPVRQRILGQYFTPRVVAERIATEPQLADRGVLRLLDPGAGSGSLTAALVARVLRECPGLRVEVTAVEVEQVFHEQLHATLQDCRDTARAAGGDVDLVLF